MVIQKRSFWSYVGRIMSWYLWHFLVFFGIWKKVKITLGIFLPYLAHLVIAIQNTIDIPMVLPGKALNFPLNTKIYQKNTRVGNFPWPILQYINIKSNHPKTITKNIPKSINRRLSDLSSTADIFNNAANNYQLALNTSGYKYNLVY